MKTLKASLILMMFALVACSGGGGASVSAMPTIAPIKGPVPDLPSEDNDGDEQEDEETVIIDDDDEEESQEPELPENPSTFGTIFQSWGDYDVDVWFDFRGLGFDADTVIQFTKNKYVEVIPGTISVTTMWKCQVTVMFKGTESEGTIRFKNAKVIDSNTPGVIVNQPCPDYETTKTVEFFVFGDTAIIDGVEFQGGGL